MEITDERTESSTTWANPSGTLTTELSSVPIRVERDGGWVPVDYDLKLVDGVVKPSAGDVDVVFSAGGNADLVRMSDSDGAALSVAWDGKLPTPSLSGPVATYREVLPGVDLLMTAIPGGYTEVLKVKTAEAADNPALDQLEFPVEVSGSAELTSAAGGGLEVTDGSDDPMLVSNAPLMWDSSGATKGAGLGEGDHSVEIPVAVSATAMIVDPDQDMLTSKATTFPVFIDPDAHVNTGNRNHWLMVQKGASSAFDWSNDRYVDNYGEGVGYQNFSGTSTKRLFWEFGLPNSKFPNGANVVDATFRALETHAASCTARNVNLDRVPANTVKASTNWGNQPSQTNSGNLATNDTQVYTSGSCSHQPEWLAFHSNALATAVENSLGDNEIDLRLSASESDSLAWKRFYNNAKLEIEWNRPPTDPTDLGWNNAPTGHDSCGSYIPFSDVNDMPRMRATVHDPDGDRMKAIFTVDRWSGLEWLEEGSVTTVKNSSTDVWWADGANATGPLTDYWVKPWGQWDEAKYRFRVRGKDDYTTGSLSSPCAMYLDAQDPKLAVTGTVTNPVSGLERALDPEEWLGTAETLHLKLDPLDSGWGPNNDFDTVSYTLTPDKGSQTTVSAPSTRQVLDVPIPLSDKVGERWITVQAVDRAGRTSQPVTLLFRVHGAVEKARYDLDEGAGTTVSEHVEGLSDPPTGPDFTLSSGVQFVIQHQDEIGDDTFLRFDGSTGQATASSPAIDTGSPFSVSAYVRPESVASRRVLVSQSNSAGQTFSLAIEPGCGAACATFTVKDPSTGTSYTVTSTVAVTTDSWYVVGGSFDNQLPQHRIKVWVGHQATESSAKTIDQATLALPSSFVPGASTATAIGRDLAGGYWSGDVEDLRFYIDEVSPADISVHVEHDNPNTN